jgi:hypothetical protein
METETLTLHRVVTTEPSAGLMNAHQEAVLIGSQLAWLSRLPVSIRAGIRENLATAYATGTAYGSGRHLTPEAGRRIADAIRTGIHPKTEG